MAINFQDLRCQRAISKCYTLVLKRLRTYIQIPSIVNARRSRPFRGRFQSIELHLFQFAKRISIKRKYIVTQLCRSYKINIMLSIYICISISIYISVYIFLCLFLFLNKRAIFYLDPLPNSANIHS